MANPLTSSSGTLRPMLVLAMPVFAEELLTLLVGWTDWWLAGNYLEGDSPKAAMGLMAYAMWLLPSLFSAVAIGATALIARFTGANQRDKACMFANQAVVTGAIMALATTLAVATLAAPFVDLMELEAEAARLASLYLWIIVPAIPAIMIEQVGAACLRGAGDTVSGFIAKSAVNVVNVLLSLALVTGWGPFPKLGFAGLPIGTAVGHCVGGVIILALLIKGRAGVRLHFRWLRPRWELIRRILRIGLPGGIDVLAVITCHLIYCRVINSLGTAAAAAHGLGIQIEALAYLPGSAFQVAAATMAGQYLGAADPRRASWGVWTACLVGGGFMVAAGVAFYFAGQYLTAFFTGSFTDPTGVQTALLLKVVAWSMPSLALTMILTGALRGAGDTTWPLIFTFVGYLCIRIPGAYVLAWDEIAMPLVGVTITGMGWGVIGAWWAMVADVVLRSMLVLARFVQGGWRMVKV